MALTHSLAEAGTRGVPAASEKYIAELDGIRAVAVAFVVVAHYGLGFIIPGGFGVTLFFFLSGYLITTLFYAEYGLNRRISIPQFYLRRWLRLTPPLIILVVLASVFHGFSRNFVGGGPVPTGTIVSALFYYSNYYDLSWGLDPGKAIPFEICWSLAIEEHFYLVWPWILRRFIRQPEKLSLIVAGLCAAVLVWRLIAFNVLGISSDHIYMATDSRIDSILYGALLRVLFETRWGPALVRLLTGRAGRIAGLLALLMTFVVRDENFRQTIRYSIQGLALMPFFTTVLTEDPRALLRRALARPSMVLIGRLSYSIYLFHLLARTPAEVWFGLTDRLAQLVVGALLTAVLSYSVYIFVERPLGHLRHRLRARGGSAPARPASAIAPLSEASMLTLPGEPLG